MRFSSGPYYSPMDREYHTPAEKTAREEPELEKPIVPISELGVTIVEKDQVTGGNFIQNLDATMRMGASKGQLVFTTPHTSPMGGRVKAYGKEVRESMRELARANSFQIEGIEMPTSSMSNLSGYDAQRHVLIEQKRRQDIQEVKDAIKFLADVGGGGGVDIWSQEFTRDIYDAKWNDGSFEAYEGEKQYAAAYVVDERTGRVQEIMKGQPIFEPVYKVAEQDNPNGVDVDGNPVRIRKGDWVTDDGRYIDPTKPHHLLLRKPAWDSEMKEFKTQELSWQEIEQRTKAFNERYGTNLEPEEYAIQTQIDNRWIQAKGQSLFYSQRYEDQLKQLEALKKSLKLYEKIEEGKSDEELWAIMDEDPALRYSKYTYGKRMKPTEIIRQEIGQIEHSLKHTHEASASADAQAAELYRQKEKMVSLKRYALKKSVESYAELGIAAMEETKHNPNVEKPIHVGPELGWPQAYGGHPEEFIELIKLSRKEMAERLQKEYGYSKQEAEKKAKEHIKGTFDTSHMGMWVNHFKKKHPRETEEERVARFKKWYMKMVDKMAKEDVIGGVQAVDSATGAHGHLPAGQGFLGKTIIDAVDLLKSQGWNGFIVSEGHEEEQFGRGRILLQTWKAFGADIGTGFFDQPTDWGSVEGNYFGYSNPPPYIVGAYSPSEEYRGAPFWSGLPLD